MQKHTARHQKTAVRHTRAAPARHATKLAAVPVKKVAVARMPAPTMAFEPPKMIEVMELEFTDPDVLLDEGAVVTGFDDEDF